MKLFLFFFLIVTFPYRFILTSEGSYDEDERKIDFLQYKDSENYLSPLISCELSNINENAKYENDYLMSKNQSAWQNQFNTKNIFNDLVNANNNNNNNVFFQQPLLSDSLKRKHPQENDKILQYEPNLQKKPKQKKTLKNLTSNNFLEVQENHNGENNNVDFQNSNDNKKLSAGKEKRIANRIKHCRDHNRSMLLTKCFTYIKDLNNQEVLAFLKKQVDDFKKILYGEQINKNRIDLIAMYCMLLFAEKVYSNKEKSVNLKICGPAKLFFDEKKKGVFLAKHCFLRIMKIILYQKY